MHDQYCCVQTIMLSLKKLFFHKCVFFSYESALSRLYWDRLGKYDLYDYSVFELSIPNKNGLRSCMVEIVTLRLPRLPFCNRNKKNLFFGIKSSFTVGNREKLHMWCICNEWTNNQAKITIDHCRLINFKSNNNSSINILSGC